ncbi:MAG TPA: HEAT repeat domain-containing protein [Isosphaeraceae bacterium]|jgi:hypothetical protein|nr:HEAT repeat domain-containing protein [Isosphaeraceae bacterium]
MTPSTPSDRPGPAARGARLAEIRSINDDAIVVARAEDHRRRARRLWWWLGGAALALGSLVGLAQIQRVILRARRATSEGPIANPTLPGTSKVPVAAGYVGRGRRLGPDADPGKDIAALADPDPEVRRAAAGRLGSNYPAARLDPTAIGNALLKALKDPDEGVRIEAAGSLAAASGQFSLLRYHDPKAVMVATNALLELLLDESPKVREAALLALDTLMPDPENVARLKPLLEDADPAVRMAAAALIVRLGDGEVAADALADAYDLEHQRFPSPTSLEHLKTLGRRFWGPGPHQQGPILAALVDGLTEPDCPTRRAAALGLADLGRMDFDSDKVADALAAILRTSPDLARRSRALNLLRSIAADTPSVRDALRFVAKSDPDPRLRADAAGDPRLNKGKANGAP